MYLATQVHVGFEEEQGHLAAEALCLRLLLMMGQRLRSGRTLILLLHLEDALRPVVILLGSDLLLLEK